MIKRPEEIALMAESGRLLASVFGYLDGLKLIGMSTMQSTTWSSASSSTSSMRGRRARASMALPMC